MQVGLKSKQAKGDEDREEDAEANNDDAAAENEPQQDNEPEFKEKTGESGAGGNRYMGNAANEVEWKLFDARRKQ